MDYYHLPLFMDELIMTNATDNKLELIDDELDDNRPNRLCVSLSDIHLTDGTVGIQNLRQETWNAFYACLAERCRRYDIREMTFVLDGDVVDMIRTEKWAKNNVYPWQRESKEFSRIVNEIIKDIVEDIHKDFLNGYGSCRKIYINIQR